MTHFVAPCRFVAALALVAILALAAPLARAGAQAEEQLAPSVVAGLAAAVADRPVPPDYARRPEVAAWIDSVGGRLAARIPDVAERRDFLATVHYEAVRAALDPELVLGVIHHESGFHKYALSSADARGYMQVMPFWTRVLGNAQHNLFHLRTNLRYGCTILRHYLALENGDLVRALGRYNGSLGRMEYPNAVLAAVARYRAAPATAVSSATPVATLSSAAPALITVSSAGVTAH